jgi:hypothetical protein
MTKFENVMIDTGGAGDYVLKADIQIRRIKEMVRGVKAVLPWKLPPCLLRDLIAFAVFRINIKIHCSETECMCKGCLYWDKAGFLQGALFGFWGLL